MITGINANETKPYTSKLDPDKDNPTIFHVGVLDPFLRAYIEDQATSFEVNQKDRDGLADAKISMNKRNLLAVKFGLKGLENFLDPQTKKAVVFSTISVAMNKANYNGLTDQILKMFPKALIDELAQVILEENSFTEAQRKN